MSMPKLPAKVPFKQKFQVECSEPKRAQNLLSMVVKIDQNPRPSYSPRENLRPFARSYRPSFLTLLDLIAPKPIQKSLHFASAIASILASPNLSLLAAGVAMASFAVNCPKTSALLPANPNPKHNLKHRNSSVVLFQSALKSNRALIAGSQSSKRNQNDIMRVSAQLNEIALEKSSNSLPPSEKEESTKISAPDTTLPDAATITTFMNQVASLVKLVDSKDIMEVELKQQNCEILIRKKEALPQPPAPPMVMMQSQPQAMYQSPPQFAPASAGPAPPASATSAPPTPAKPKSSHPPMKSPMDGTFYRASAPGAAPFVKVGDKIQKGQVVCIIEAMKLMNEIEAEQSGTVVDILAEDGKPVSLDMPILVIEP